MIDKGIFYRHNRQKKKEKEKKIVYYQEKVKFYKIPLKNIGNVFIMVRSVFERMKFYIDKQSGKEQT